MTELQTQPTHPAPAAVQALEGDVSNLQAVVDALVVDDQAGADAAAHVLDDLAALKSQIVEFYEPFVSQANKLHKSLTKDRREKVDPIDAAIATVRGKVGSWAEAEQRRRDEVARAEREAARKADEKRRLEEAVEADREGAPREEVDAILDDAESPPVTTAEKAPVRVAGASLRPKYTCEVVDVRKLLAAIVDGTVSIEAVSVNSSWLNRQASQLKETFDYPGCKLRKTTGVSRR